MRPPPSKHKDSKSKSLLYSALSGAVQSLKAESGAVMLIDEKTGELYTKEAFSISTPIINVPGRISKKNALGKHNASFYAAKHGKLLLINDIKTFKLENPKFYCSINPKLFKTTIIAPIMEGNKTIAVLNLYNKLGNCKFTKEDCIHAKRLADHCGAALKLEKKNFVLKTMNEITKEIHQTNDIHKVFRMIVEKGKKILNCNNVSVMMVEEGMLVVKESSDIKLLGQKREAGAGVSGWVWKTGEPVLMKKTEDASLFKFKTLNKPGSFIVAPLTLKYDNPLALNVSSKEAMTIGVLNFSDRSDSLSFNEDDLEIIVNFANLAAIALEKVKFYMEVKKAYLSTVEALAAAIDAKDKSSFSHLKRVVRFSLAIADRLGLSSKDKESIHFAALLHDVGKIGIDENILNKPGRLTDAEYKHMKTHVVEGVKILESAQFLENSTIIVRHHHEKFNGSGYPDGLRKEQIPIGSRILAVTDAYDAMISDRVYRKKKSSEEAVKEIKMFSGTQFDPKIAAIFIRILKRKIHY